MLKFLIVVTVTATGIQVGYICYGTNMANADSNFITTNPGFNDSSLYSRTVTAQA